MFLTDVMLIKLGRWLRILGLESASPALDRAEEIDDDALIFRAVKEKRILLTMDRELARRAVASGAKAVLIPSKMIDVEEQLAYVFKETGITADLLQEKVLCTRCGRALFPATADEVKGRVPGDVSETHKEFWMCGSCGQVYWEGSHWRNIKKTVEKMKASLSNREQ